VTEYDDEFEVDPITVEAGNRSVVIGGLYFLLTSNARLDPDQIEIDRIDPEGDGPALIVDLEHMLSRYRITVERLEE
jgi:hypothetical protein